MKVIKLVHKQKIISLQNSCNELEKTPKKAIHYIKQFKSSIVELVSFVPAEITQIDLQEHMLQRSQQQNQKMFKQQIHARSIKDDDDNLIIFLTLLFVFFLIKLMIPSNSLSLLYENVVFISVENLYLCFLSNFFSSSFIDCDVTLFNLYEMFFQIDELMSFMSNILMNSLI